MAKLNVKQIQAHPLALLDQESGGLRWGEMLKAIHDRAPGQERPFYPARMSSPVA